MSFLPALATWQFALAGAICAAGPVILHLLNRRRFRVVEWAAMQFLREAMKRSRRIMQIRDLVLMLLRTAAVLFFGLALARPFLAAREEQLDAGQPVHAVLLVDNSLSMGYQTLEGSLLDRAKQRAGAFIERLPVGSRISVIPLCGSEFGTSSEPFDTKPFALEALQRISVVDRATNIRQALTEAKRAAESVTDLAERFIVISDQQRANWSDLGSLSDDQTLPAMQLVDVSDDEWDNTWIADVRVPDGVADAETPTTIQVEIRHHGREPRRDVRVGLWVRDQEVDSQIVSFDSGDATQEATFEYTFRDAQAEASRPEFIPVKVVLSPDRLVEDDERHLLVPVVAVLPVVFVDQHGTDEDLARNRIGETRHLRHLLAPTSAGDQGQQLIQIRHLQLNELDRDAVADARLVVIAGITDPGEHVTLLREYVEQGGQLLIAAGADFDPIAWNLSAWREGQGILPLPLLPELLGTLPDAANGELKPMFLSYESLGQHPYFQLAGNAEDDLRDLYAEPFFFQVAQVDASAEQVAAAERPPATNEYDPGPTWLLWSPPETGPADLNMVGQPTQSKEAKGSGNPQRAATENSANSLGSRNFRPKVLARLLSESGPPFLVERAVGRGQIVFAASGLFSNWNTLPKTNAIVMFDRILRSMMQATLPNRNYGGVDRIALPLPNDARDDRVILLRPDSGSIGQSLEPGFLRTDQIGVTIERPLTRGIYRVQALGQQANAGSSDTTVKWQIELAANGPEEESDLEPYPRESFEQQPLAQHLRWVGANEEVSLAGARIRGQDLWWYLALLVFVLLLVELAVIAWPAFANRSSQRILN